MMKIVFIGLLFSFFVNAEEDLKTVPDLDLHKYQGLWHEVAAIPQSFQEDCFKSTTAHYTLLENEQVKVLNSCEKEDGELKVAEGRARKNSDYNESSKLEVTFVKIFGQWVWSFSGDYWVFQLGEGYSFSVVGSPDLSSLWILSRTEVLSKETLSGIAKSLDEMGFDTCAILLSRNEKQDFKQRPRLCDFVQ